MKIYEVFKKIQETAGTKAKKQILKENMCDTIALIFEDTYGKQKYYIKQFVKPECSGQLTLDNDYSYFRSTIEQLATRNVTGLAAYEFLESTIMDFDEESQEILCKIIDRNLKIGISLDNYLDVVGNKGSKYEVALAENLSKVTGVNPIDGTYFISRKLDGCRCNCFVTRYGSGPMTSIFDIKFKSRQGKEFTTLDNLKPAVEKALQSIPPGSYVLDGEVCMIDENGNENFHKLMKEVTRKNHTIENPVYKIFDLLLLDDFEGKQESLKFSDRLARMYNLVEQNNNIQILEQERVTSQEIFDKWIRKAKESEWEGCMLRKDAPYKKGRTKDLLKIKNFQDAEYIVQGVEVGKATYNNGGHKEYDVVSAIKILHKDNIVSVGSGLSKEQRLKWFEHPEEIVGKTVTIQYFEETVDSKTGLYSLRFPVLKYVYDNGREI